jgi:hypothetical protein
MPTASSAAAGDAGAKVLMMGIYSVASSNLPAVIESRKNCGVTRGMANLPFAFRTAWVFLLIAASVATTNVTRLWTTLEMVPPCLLMRSSNSFCGTPVHDSAKSWPEKHAQEAISGVRRGA